VSPTSGRSSRTITLRTAAAEETRQLARAVARALRPGDVVALTGELGAGKTTFVQGLGSELGVQRPITSPTFTLVRTYRGNSISLVHVDVYRLDHLQDFVELGEETVLGSDQVTCIEWGDTVDAMLPSDRLEVEVDLGEDEDDRVLVLRGRGGWSDRLVDLLPALQGWLPEAPAGG
jgi:tRNA threonylcarbamoyladenosine biosynthesis protein TsaE